MNPTAAPPSSSSSTRRGRPQPARAVADVAEPVPFPTEGRPVDELIEEMRSNRGDDARWRAGRTFSLVYNPGDAELERLQEAVALEYLHENYLNPFAFPSLLRMAQQVVGMAADLFGRPAAGGQLTSGGTESLILAVQAARELGRATGR